MFTLKPTPVVGCYELSMQIARDKRGHFAKVFHSDWFKRHGLRYDFQEQYYTVSYHRVLRGLHFQLPPHDHAKMVYCISGSVLDVAVDLRRDSPSYKEFVLTELSTERGNMVYLDAGLAHGFYTLSDSATLVYNVTSVYAPSHDAGIRWDSAGIPWPDKMPILSERDRTFPNLADFDSPFTQCQEPAHGRRT